MIVKRESKAIKKFFGINFAQKIADILRGKRITNQNGDFFKAHSVSDVLNGQNHSILEDHIRMVWEERVDLESDRRKKIMEKTKALI